jgi:hypothetical protein
MFMTCMVLLLIKGCIEFYICIECIFPSLKRGKIHWNRKGYTGYLYDFRQIIGQSLKFMYRR